MSTEFNSALARKFARSDHRLCHGLGFVRQGKLLLYCSCAARNARHRQLQLQRPAVEPKTREQRKAERRAERVAALQRAIDAKIAERDALFREKAASDELFRIRADERACLRDDVACRLAGMEQHATELYNRKADIDRQLVAIRDKAKELARDAEMIERMEVDEEEQAVTTLAETIYAVSAIDADIHQLQNKLRSVS